MNIRDLILAPEKPVRVDVRVWDFPVFVRRMTASEMMEWNGLAFDAAGNFIKDKLRSRLLAFTLCDAEGCRLFTVDDIDALEQVNAVAMVKLFEIADDLNRLETAGDAAVTDAEKN